MTVSEAKKFVDSELRRIVAAAGSEAVLQPWDIKAHPLALEHWSRVQQRIALSHNQHNRWCCEDLHLTAKPPSEAQRRAQEAAGERLRASRTA